MVFHLFAEDGKQIQYDMDPKTDGYLKTYKGKAPHLTRRFLCLAPNVKQKFG